MSSSWKGSNQLNFLEENVVVIWEYHISIRCYITYIDYTMHVKYFTPFV
jgi:hypothetical protein